MSILQDSGPRSNDLLHSLVAKHVLANLDCQIVTQSAEDRPLAGCDTFGSPAPDGVAGHIRSFETSHRTTIRFSKRLR